jgi:enoyl-CoA hydratase/carnithine racemase
MYHLFLCDEFNSERAYKIGLVQEVVPAGQQIERAMQVAETIAKNAPIGIQVTKEAALKFIESGEQPSIIFRKSKIASSTAKISKKEFSHLSSGERPCSAAIRLISVERWGCSTTED